MRRRRVPRSSRPEAPAEPRSACRRQALELLARREHSRLELQRKLRTRAHPPDAIETVLDALEAEGLLEAARFVESFVRARIGRGQGPRRIRAELLQRGVGETDIGAQLGDAAHDWNALAGEVRRKRFGTPVPGDFAERARQMRFLHYRGFERSQIEAALDLEAVSD